jgi:hypothetical protein
LHCFACPVGGTLQSIDSTLRFGAYRVRATVFAVGLCFTVSFVDYTLCQSDLVIQPCIDLLALPAAILPAIDETFRFWSSKRSDHRFLGRFQSILRANTLCHSNFVIQPSHRFACFIISNLTDQNSLQIKIPARSAGFDLTVAYFSTSDRKSELFGVVSSYSVRSLNLYKQISALQPLHSCVPASCCGSLLVGVTVRCQVLEPLIEFVHRSSAFARRKNLRCSLVFARMAGPAENLSLRFCMRIRTATSRIPMLM